MPPNDDGRLLASSPVEARAPRVGDESSGLNRFSDARRLPGVDMAQLCQQSLYYKLSKWIVLRVDECACLSTRF